MKTSHWALMLCALGIPAAALGRVWSDDNGSFRAEAELLGVDNGRVVLQRPSGGTVIRIPLERLSKVDRDFLDQSGALTPDNSDPSLPKGVDAAAAQKADIALKDLLKDDLAAAKTPAQREKLVDKLRSLAVDSGGDKASQFVLLRKAAEIAAALGNSQLMVFTMSDLELLVKDPTPAWLDVLAALDTHHPIQDGSLLVDKINSLVGLLVAKDDYEGALKLGNLLLTIGRLEKDAGLQAAARAKIADATAAKEELKRIAPAKEKLKQDPSDEEANRSVGRFLCLFKGDFAAGLPLLAASSDKALKLIAQADLKGEKTAAEMLAVGDSWLTTSKNLTPRTAAQERGVYWFHQARPLSDSVTRARIDAKLAPLVQREWIDLLARCEFPRDQIGQGYWTKEGSTLISATPSFAAMKFPIAPGKNDYELAVEFERVSGDYGDVAIIFPVRDHLTSLVFYRRMAAQTGPEGADGLEMVGGKFGDDNATTIKPSLLKTGRRMVLRINVDVAGDDAEISVYHDRQRMIAWQGHIAALDPWAIGGIANKQHIIGIWHRNCNLVVQSAKLLPK